MKKNGTLDADARKYWMQLRERAGVSTDIDATIAATDLSKEKDFGGVFRDFHGGCDLV